ncbi:hypothetical protein VKT23_019893 [Stygiomarasmius scandens]
MGPGSRHDTLDDHWGHWNFVKMVGLGSLLLHHLLNAIYERSVHTRALKEFMDHQGSVTEDWKQQIQEWEAELSVLLHQWEKANPFEMPKSGLMEAEIKLELTQLEAEQEQAGIPLVHSISLTLFISQGLELEHQQRTLKLDVKSNRFETATQKVTLIQRRTKLQCAIGKFRSVQATYMPGTLQYLAKDPPRLSMLTPDTVPHVEPGSENKNKTTAELPEEIPLCLPSALPVSYCVEGCCAGLLEIEQKLREGQLRNSLNQLWNHLHMKSRLLTYRTTNIVHQGAVTRSKAIFNRNQRQIEQCTLKYHMAWAAMSGLVGEGAVKQRKLEHEDICLMDGTSDWAIGIARKKKGKKNQKEKEQEDRDQGTQEELAKEQTLREHLKDVCSMVGEGTREVSWIWREGGTGEAVDDATLEEIVRVEWCKAYAHAKRWEEEVVLVKEEMRRCLVTLEYNAMKWDGRCDYNGPLAKGCRDWKDDWEFGKSYVGPLSSGTDSFHAEGVRAYAHSQAAVYRRLGLCFQRLWSGLGDKEHDIEDGQDIGKIIRACNANADDGEDGDDDPAEEICGEDIEVVVEVEDDDEEV